jgi:hypothetical protein
MEATKTGDLTDSVFFRTLKDEKCVVELGHQLHHMHHKSTDE